jgi:AcrR family transcriptional regulator
MDPAVKIQSSTADLPSGPPATPKYAAVVEAAAEIFLEQGFGNASMDEIARRAGVSKATVYSYFDSKPALFGAIVQQRCQRSLPAMLGEFSDRPVEEALTAVGRQFLDVLMMPGSLPLYRTVLAEAPRFPELGRVFYDVGPGRVAAGLAEYLAAQQRRGLLAIPDPRLAAEQFLAAVLGHIHVRLLLGLADRPPTSAERERAVATAVSTFLDGCRRRPG